MWYKLSIQSRMFIVLSLLLVMSSIISITKQSTMTINSELEQLKSEILPSHLESLASQISSEILPFITASELMTNNKFVEEWVKTGAANSQLPLIESTLGSTKKMLGSDFTFYVEHIYLRFKSHWNRSENNSNRSTRPLFNLL